MCEALWLSVDPYMRPYSKKFPLGSTMIGGQVAKYACLISLTELDLNVHEYDSYTKLLRASLQNSKWEIW